VESLNARFRRAVRHRQTQRLEGVQQIIDESKLAASASRASADLLTAEKR
jgi:hypothetical protein